MLNIFANSFMNAARQPDPYTQGSRAHWTPGERFDNRRNAELEAHLTARRRD